jgi:Asp-tRNA(Asn)/Glu-tRNA(Gln) amidotransferase A subunit family amidase
VRLTETDVTESVYKLDHNVLGGSSGGSAQAAVIMKSQM